MTARHLHERNVMRRPNAHCFDVPKVIEYLEFHPLRKSIDSKVQSNFAVLLYVTSNERKATMSLKMAR
jgi:DNA-binding transcriptional regulator YiaG